jgi:hypothetical protein
VLYRVFPYLPGSDPTGPRGPLHVARERQGAGRHDNPDHYGALYASRAVESALAEAIQGFRGQDLADRDLTRTDGARLAVASIDDSAVPELTDLDEPRELARRRLRPSRVATGHRHVTQRLALDLFEEGLAGFAWWSALEASWSNVTLFADRTLGLLALADPPEPLAFDRPELRTVAEALGVGLS